MTTDYPTAEWSRKQSSYQGTGARPGKGISTLGPYVGSPASSPAGGLYLLWQSCCASSFSPCLVCRTHTAGTSSCLCSCRSRWGLCSVLRLSPKVCHRTNTVWASWNKTICFSHLHPICEYFSGDSVPSEAFIFQWKKSRTQKSRLNAFRNKQPYKTTWALLEINPKTKANSWSGLATRGSSAWEFLALGSNIGSILPAGYMCDQLVSARTAFPIWMDLDILLALLYCSYT